MSSNNNNVIMGNGYVARAARGCYAEIRRSLAVNCPCTLAYLSSDERRGARAARMEHGLKTSDLATGAACRLHCTGRARHLLAIVVDGYFEQIE